MEAKLQIVTVTDLAKQVEVPEVPPLSEETLSKIERTMRRGLVLHQVIRWKEGELPLPVHVHPNVILALIQEVRRGREVEHNGQAS